MRIKKKGASIAFTATLLASLLATVAAPLAFAAVTLTNVGNVPRGGASTTPFSITLTENSAGCLSAAGVDLSNTDDLTLNITDSALGDTVTFTGTPAVSAPGSLGATAVVGTGANDLIIRITASDINNVETITVSGLTINATTAAALGAMRATLTAANAAVLACFVGSAGPATGILQAAVAATAGASAIVNVTSACPFVNTGTGAPPAGQATFSANGPDGRDITATALVGGQQTLTFTTAGAFAHAIGETVTQTVPTCAGTGALSSPGTVVDSAIFNTPTSPTVVPGENNQPAGDLTISERTAGFLPANSTVTCAIDTPGVTFSRAPTASSTGSGGTPSGTVPAIGAATTSIPITLAAGSPAFQTTTGGNGALAPGTAVFTPAGARTIITAPAPVAGVQTVTIDAPITTTAGSVTQTLAATATFGATTGAVSPDLRTVTITVPTASNTTTGPATLTITNIAYDIAATVAPGTKVNVTCTLSGGRVLTPVQRSNAVVGRVIVGIGASPVPTVFIGENNQPSALVTLTEQGAAFFTGGTGSNNVFALCLTSGETYTIAPYAVVTAGDLRLREGAISSPDNIVQGTLTTSAGQSCAYWTVFTASATASRIEIRAADPASPGNPLASGPTAGPRLSVSPGLAPGSTQAGIRVGTFADVTGASTIAQQSLVVIATRAFRPNNVVVAAVSQPACDRGTTDCLAGNITITEGLNGQFKPGEIICVTILPRTNQPTLQDTFFSSSARTNNRPILNTNTASGLAVTFDKFDCDNVTPSANLGTTSLNSFQFRVTQQSFGPDKGVITISNLHYATTADAINGTVLVNVFGTGASPSFVEFDQTISNARIGAAASRTSINNTSAIGVTTTAAFTASTKVVDVADYITWRATMSPSMSGERVVVWIARKAANGTWGAFTRFSTRAVNAQGIAYFHYDNGDAPGWISVKFTFLGNNQHAAGSSLARQGRYL